MTSKLGTREQRWLAFGLGFYMLSSLIAMATMSIGAVVLAVALLFAYRGPRGLWNAIQESARNRYVGTYYWAALAMALSLTLSVLWARISPMGYGGDFIHVELSPNLSKLWYLFWPLVILPALGGITDSLRSRVLRVWFLGMAILAVIGVIQHYTGWPRPQNIPSFPESAARYHATIFLGHHLSVASILIFPFFGVLDYLASSQKARELGLPRGVLALVAILGAIVLFLTFSRTLWIALPLGILVWIFWNYSGKGSRPWLGRAVVFAGVGVAIVLAAQNPVIHSRLANSLGVATRQRLWEANWEFFKTRPVLGVGWRQNQELSGIYLSHQYPGQRVFQGHAHNNFLDLLAGTGSIGAASWLFWCGVVFWILWPAARRSESFARGLLCAWIVFHLNGLTQLNFWEAKVTHQMMLMVAWSLLWASATSRAERAR